MNEFKILIILTIISFILFLVKIYFDNKTKKEITNEQLLNFIYYGTISNLEGFNDTSIKNFDDFKSYMKIILFNKLIEDIELDEEYKIIVNEFIIYKKISEIIDEDDDINVMLQKKYDILYNKDEEEYEDDSSEYTIPTENNTVDISKE